MVNGKANYNIHILHLQKTKKKQKNLVIHWESSIDILIFSHFKTTYIKCKQSANKPNRSTPPLSFLILTIFSQFVIKYNIKSRSQMLLLIRDGKWLFLKWPRKEQTKWTDKKNIDQVTNLITSRGYKSSILYEYLNLIKESFSYRKITQ